MREIINELNSVKFKISQKLKYSAEVKGVGETKEKALDNAVKLAKEVEGILRDKNHD